MALPDVWPPTICLGGVPCPFPAAYKFCSKKFLICSFIYGIKEKSTGENRPDRNPRGLEPRGFLRLGPDERGDQDAAAKIRRQTRAGQRGAPQDMGRRMAEPLRRHSAPGLKGLRGLTRSFVMTGEVRLVEEEALNLPVAAAMAAAGSIERGPSMMDHWGPYARSVSGLHRLPEVRF